MTKVTWLVVGAVIAGVLGISARAAAEPAPGSMELVSLSSAGLQGDQDSDPPSIRSRGRFVAFVSLSENLLPGNTNLAVDVRL